MTDKEKELGRAVAARVSELQRQSMDDNVRYADVPGRLARLRRAVGAEPGSVPEVWSDTIGSLPETLWNYSDTPSRYESAAHTAISFFAVHKQSTPGAVHQPGISMGAAARRLASARAGVRGEHDPAIFRRFQALATASSRSELNHHLRSLITLMRSEGVQLDYGMLASDLARMEVPEKANRVRLRWGRDYHRVADKPNDTADNSSDDSRSKEIS